MYISPKKLYKASNSEGGVWHARGEEIKELQDREIEEFSYKLNTGDSHFKGNIEKRYSDAIKGSSTPKKYGLIEIGRIGVTDLSECTELDEKKLAGSDVVFVSAWNGTSRSVGIFVVKGDLSVNVLNADQINYVQNHTYRIHFPDIPGYDVMLTDNFFLGEASYKGIAFFRPDSPTRCHYP